MLVLTVHKGVHINQQGYSNSLCVLACLQALQQAQILQEKERHHTLNCCPSSSLRGMQVSRIDICPEPDLYWNILLWLVKGPSIYGGTVPNHTGAESEDAELQPLPPLQQQGKAHQWSLTHTAREAA